MFDDSIVTELTNAIITQACRDYVKGRIQEITKGKARKKYDPEEIKKFFYGPEFAMYTKIHPDYIIHMLEDEVEEKLADYSPEVCLEGVA